jgi:hypothetical protein
MQNSIERGVIAKVRGEEMSAAHRLLSASDWGNPSRSLVRLKRCLLAVSASRLVRRCMAMGVTASGIGLAKGSATGAAR